jgi:P4 family phage/plasmid primase-like protien
MNSTIDLIKIEWKARADSLYICDVCWAGHEKEPVKKKCKTCKRNTVISRFEFLKTQVKQLHEKYRFSRKKENAWGAFLEDNGIYEAAEFVEEEKPFKQRIVEEETPTLTATIKPPISENAAQAVFIASNMKNGSTGMIQSILSTWIQKQHTIVTINDNNEMRYYKDGIYESGAEGIIGSYCQNTMQHAGVRELSTNHMISEVIGHVQRETRISREDFDNRRADLCCLQNGVFNLKTGEFSEHSPKYCQLAKLPIIYNQSATCPAFEKFVSEIVAPGDVPLVYELLGYCVYPSAEFDKAFMFFGEGHNGKSTLISVIKEFLGQRNCSSVPLQKFDGENNKFAVAELHGKLVNLAADLSPSSMKNTGNLKMATGGDLLYAERKGQRPFTFENTAKLIFSANRIPITEDNSRAFGRRWMLINFPNVFEDTGDKKLLDSLKTPKEISGIFIKALGGLWRLLENQKFTNEKTSDDTMELWSRLSDTVACFIADEIDAAYDGWISKRELWDAFSRYCVGKNGAMVSEKTFFVRFKNRIRTEETQKAGLRGLMGIRLKTQKKEEFEYAKL